MKLVKPDLSYAEQILAYKREMEEHHVSFDGCAGHENTETVQKWLDFETRLKAQYQAGYVPSQVYLYVDENDRIIGMIDFRHPLTVFSLPLWREYRLQYQAVFSMTRTWSQDACNAAGKMQRNRGKQCPADM